MRPPAWPGSSARSPTSRSTTARTTAGSRPCSIPASSTRARRISCGRPGAWADDLGVPIQLHAAMNQREFHHILEQHGQTPIQLLHSIGFLKPRTGLGHCVFHNEHSWCHYPYARRPEAPGRQRRHGRPRAVQVRQDGRAVRVVRALSRARDQHRARHRHVPARSDPRDALGRLDVPHGRRQLPRGPARRTSSTPPRSAARAISGATISAGWPRGPRPTSSSSICVTCTTAPCTIRSRRWSSAVPGATSTPSSSTARCSSRVAEPCVIDEHALLRDVQAEGERLWHAIPQWHWTAKPLDDIVPPSYPIRHDA